MAISKLFMRRIVACSGLALGQSIGLSIAKIVCIDVDCLGMIFSENRYPLLRIKKPLFDPIIWPALDKKQGWCNSTMFGIGFRRLVLKAKAPRSIGRRC